MSRSTTNNLFGNPVNYFEPCGALMTSYGKEFHTLRPGMQRNVLAAVNCSGKKHLYPLISSDSIVVVYFQKIFIFLLHSNVIRWYLVKSIVQFNGSLPKQSPLHNSLRAMWDRWIRPPAEKTIHHMVANGMAFGTHARSDRNARMPQAI